MAVLVLAVLAAVLAYLPKAQTVETSASGTGITYLPGQTKMNPAYGKGVTVAGVTCGPGVRQVPFSHYAPPCEPAWHGNNGGATSPGVTATTINLTYRKAATDILAALYTIIPESVVGTNANAITTMQAYINFFNKYYELYGRHVVLEPFAGEGNFIAEDTGAGAPQAEADAVNVATSLHAFADMSLVDSSVVYTDDLAANKVVAFGLYVQNRQWYAAGAPYQYSPGPNCTQQAQAIGAILGKQLGGLPTEFAEGSLKGQPQKIGIFYQNVPTSYDCEQSIAASLEHYGVKPAATADITFNLSELPNEAADAIAAMKKAGVTTIICSSCDPVTPQYYMKAAEQANYHPEWFLQSYFAANSLSTPAYTRLLPADQRDQILTIGKEPTAEVDNEALEAYRLGNTDPSAQLNPGYVFIYESLMQFFDGLQLAGPDLTPQNLEAAMRDIPKSTPGGIFGGWDGSAGPYDPASDFQILKWTNSGVDPQDGKMGTYEACDNGQSFTFAPTITGIPSETELKCSLPTTAAPAAKTATTGAVRSAS